MDVMYPGIENPTTIDRLGAELADEQLDWIDDLKAVRLKRGLSVQAVATLMEVDASQVSRFESGSTNPTMSTVRRYAKAVEAVFRIETRLWEEEKRRMVSHASNVWWGHTDRLPDHWLVPEVVIEREADPACPR